jgi:surface protein
MADVPVIISKSIRLREGAAPSNPVNIGTPQEPLNPDGGGGVVPHNQLAGLQGGTATERYHIDEDQYNAVNGANTPSSTNVFATIADLEGVERENNTVLFDKDYVIGNAGARTGNILFDFTGARLKANSIMLHNDIVEPTFPANAKIIFGEYKINQDNYIYFEIINKGLSSEIVLVHIYQEETFPFTATFNTANTSTGSSNSDQLKLPLISTGTYDFVVDWGDNTTDVITTWNQAETTHTYLSSGIYIIKITGVCRGWEFQNTGDRLKITDISQWGDIRFTTQTNVNLGAFRGCSNLNVSAIDIPVFDVAAFAGFFRGCTSLTGNTSFNNWVMTSVTDFNRFFESCANFNQNISNWDVSNVSSFLAMFLGCTNFNQNISSWNVANCSSFRQMFESCTNFNQNLGDWNVSSATNLAGMFRLSGFNNAGSSSINDWDTSDVTQFGGSNLGMFASCPFNQNIGSWNTSSGVNFQAMFLGNTVFNQNIGSWNTGNATNMATMFLDSFAFNQNIGSWDVSKVTAFNNMFTSASSFNQNIGSWNTSEGIGFGGMFQNATIFNQDISGWNVAKSIAFNNMFNGATAFNADISGWNVGLVTNFASMFANAVNFNANISGWNVANGTNFSNMFNNATDFNQNLGSWNVSKASNFGNFMAGKTDANYSAANLDSIYNGWSLLTFVNTGLTISFGTIKYTASGQAGRDILTGAPNNWSITDGGT